MKPNPKCWFCRQEKCLLKKTPGFCSLRYCYQPSVEGIENIIDYVGLINGKKVASRANTAVMISFSVLLLKLIEPKVMEPVFEFITIFFQGR